MQYTVIKQGTIRAVLSSIGENTKTATLQSGGWSEPYALATMVMDNVLPDAEIHETERDVWYVILGHGKFILGGALIGAKDNGGGELTGSGVDKGESFDVEVGDVIDIPAGTPHQIDTRGGRLEMLIIKIAK